MDRMKTFGMYALGIIAFFFFSGIVSNVLISNSYEDIANVNIEQSQDGIQVTSTEATTNRRQGYLKGEIRNTSNQDISSKYMRIRSYSSGGNLLQTKYIKLENLQSGETRNFSARFTVGEINSFDVDYVDEMPDDRTFLDKMFENVKNFIKSENKLESIHFEPLTLNMTNLAVFIALMYVIYHI